MSEEQTNVAPEVQATETLKEEVKVDLKQRNLNMRKNFKKKKSKKQKS